MIVLLTARSASDNAGIAMLLLTSLILFILGRLIYKGKMLWILSKEPKGNPSKLKIQQQFRLARRVGSSAIWAAVVTLFGGLSSIRVSSDSLHTLFFSAFIFSIVGPTIYLTQKTNRS